MVNADAINLIRHIVGNHIAEGRLLHTNQSFRSADDVRKIQRDVAERLSLQLEKERISDQETLGILEALKKSDWGDKSSYEEFRSLYDTYVAPVQQEITLERDSLFKKR